MVDSSPDAPKPVPDRPEGSPDEAVAGSGSGCVSGGGFEPGTPVSVLEAVGRRREAALAKMNLYTLGDLLRHVPTRYERVWAEGPIVDLPMNALGSTRGMIVATRTVGSGGGRRGGRAYGASGGGRFEATIEDHSGRLRLTWFNSPFLRQKLHPGQTLRVQGKTTAYHDQPQMANPGWEILEDPNEPRQSEDRLRPVYPATEGLPSAAIEQIMDEALPKVLATVVDPLSGQLLAQHAMPPLAEAFRMVHRPRDDDEHRAARRRLAFNELFLLQLGMALKRHDSQTRLIAPRLRWSSAVDEHIRRRFPFELTASQDRVVKEITRDLLGRQPMNRLLQGDVGCGKTVVALYALLLAAANRKQGALMAPTELLAEQHYLSISDMLAGSNLRIELLSAGVSTAGSSQRPIAATPHPHRPGRPRHRHAGPALTRRAVQRPSLSGHRRTAPLRCDAAGGVPCSTSG